MLSGMLARRTHIHATDDSIDKQFLKCQMRIWQSNGDFIEPLLYYNYTLYISIEQIVAIANSSVLLKWIVV